MHTHKNNAGFTLVELAIVLVIIGLLVGGVLVGQDLIKAAEIRAVSSDIERFNTGAGAFRTKYSGVPGDLLGTKAASFGLPYGDGNDGEGDGDGILENNTTTKTGAGGENILFWTHLSSAQFIPYGISQYSTAAGANAALAEVATTAWGTAATYLAAAQLAMPQLRIRDTGFIHAYGSSGLNYYMIGNFGTNGGATGALTATDTLSPREALGIDEKLDDGNAARGIVLSFTGTLAAATAPSGGADGAAMSNLSAGDCYNTGATTAALAGNYNTGSEDLANALGCAIRIRTGF